MKALIVNAGSSSHKLSLYEITGDRPIKPLWKGELDWKDSKPLLLAHNAKGKQLERSLENKSVEIGLKELLESLWKGEVAVLEDLNAIEIIGHRIVHGGLKFQEACLITPEVKEEIRKLIPLAPLHNPANLQGVEWMESFFPHLPQVAAFDTAFHAHMPDKAKIYPLPLKWYQEGIQRYGFHGLSHQYCAQRVADLLNKDIKSLKIINCHLGNGSSLCAIQGGISIDTSMGFTPLEGLMMGTRCGSIDPGILLYQLREKKQSLENLDHILNSESGLKGISGFSDMRDILQHPQASSKLALDMYIYRLRAFLGAYMIHLGGADVISFTGGIGENDAQLCQEACKGLQFMGIEVDPTLIVPANQDHEISSQQSLVRLFVIHTEEEWMIAKFCWELFKGI